MKTQTAAAAMNPSTPKTEPPPSTQLRKVVFGGSQGFETMKTPTQSIATSRWESLKTSAVLCFALTVTLAQRNNPGFKLLCKQTNRILKHHLACVLIAIIATARSAFGGELTRCNAFNDSATTSAAVAAGSDQPVPLRSLAPPVLLPDGSEFKTWEQTAEHRRTFFVAQQHPQASDENPGSQDRPWKTIGRAAALLEPGDRVIVKQGLYREWVRPARGGSGPQRMITYQAAAGQKIIISGSEPFSGPWVASARGDHPPSAKSWMTDLPGTLFDGYNPFAEQNVTANMKNNPYGGDFTQPPFTLPQGLVFQDGRRMKQVADYERLADSASTYWVEPGGRRLHVRPFDDKNPHAAAFEVTTRPFAFAPQRAGLGFIRVAGFIIEQVASCFPMPQQGAISTQQGHHWIIEDNIVRQVNALGLDYGRRQTFIPYEVPSDTPKRGGVGHIIRRNAFLDCGICSISGLGTIGMLVEENYSSGCGWHGCPRLAENGGIKLLYVKHSLVRRNVVEGTVNCVGLWIDHSAVNSRITQNIIVGAGLWGGIYLEASYKPNLIDHNIVWDCKESGILLEHSGNATIANNLIGCCAGQPVLIKRPGPKGRMVDIETKRMSSAEHNRVVGNVFYGFESRGPQIPNDLDNVSDCNVFVNPPGAKPFDLAAGQQRTGRETHSVTFTSRMDFSPSDWTLRQLPLLLRLESPREPAVRFDFFASPRSLGATTEAGPFLPQNLKPEMILCTRHFQHMRHHAEH